MERKRKSERTRESILAAASTLFAERGYDRTTVRDVAERAQIDPALVIRYFKNKDGLFAEAASVELDLPTPKVAEPETLGRQLVEHFLHVWEGGESDRGMAVLLRSATSNAFAAAKMREAFERQVRPFIAAVGDPSTGQLRAALVSSHLLGVALCRYVLKLPAVVGLSREELVEHVGPTLQRYATLQ